MPKKERFPQHLGWEDFLSFMRELILWLASQVGEPDYQPSLRVGIVGKVDDYEAALTEYKIKKGLSPEKKKLKDAAIKALRVALTRLKDTLPVFFEDPDVLGQFGLAGSIDTDEDELYIQASGCMSHWALVSGDPEFAPMVPDFTVAQTAFDDFVLKREDFTITFQAMQAAQNDMEQLRIPIQEQERKIFDWYRSRYPKSDDPWWTDTPWGSTGGNGGGGTSWNKAPIATMTIPGPPLNGILAGCEPYTGTTRFDFRIAWAKKNEPAPSMPLVDTYTDIEQPTLLGEQSFPLEKNYVYYLWIRARKDGEVSEWSEVVGILWE